MAEGEPGSDCRRAGSRWILRAAKASSQAAFHQQSDGSYLVNGINADQETYTITAQTSLTGITAIRLEALADPSLVKHGPGRAGNGNFALSDFSVTAAPADGSAPAVKLKLVNPKATFEQKGLPVSAAIDADKKSAWAIDPEFGNDHAAVFEIETPVGFAGRNDADVCPRVQEQREARDRAPAHLHQHAAAARAAGWRDDAAGSDRESARGPRRCTGSATSEASRTALLDYFKRTDPEWNTAERGDSRAREGGAAAGTDQGADLPGRSARRAPAYARAGFLREDLSCSSAAT